MEPEIENYTATDKLITRATRWFAIIILVVLVVFGIKSLFQSFYYEETNDAQVQEYINPLVSRIDGYITQIRYNENQIVKKGDTLVIIDKSQYTLQQQESLAATENAASQIFVLKSAIQTAINTAAENKAQIGASRAKLVRDSQNFVRYQRLFREESATQQQLENERATLDVAKSDYRASLDNYQTGLSKVNDYKTQMAGLESEIKRRQSVSSKDSLNVSYTVITAPYDGEMGRKTIQIGQFIQINEILAFIVNHETGKWVTANFKETQVGKMYIGQEAEVEVDAFPDQVFKGKIESLSPATGSSFSVLPPDNSTGNFVKIVQRIPVRITLISPVDGIKKLRSGMNSTVRIEK